MEKPKHYDDMLDNLISLLEFVNPSEKQHWFQCKKCNDVGIHLFAHGCLHIICERCYVDKQMCPVCKCDPSGIGLTKVTLMEDVKKVNVYCPLKISDCQEISSILNIVEHVKISHPEKIEQLLATSDNLKTASIMEKITHEEIEEMKQSLNDLKESLRFAMKDISELQKHVGMLEDTVQNERKERHELDSEIRLLLLEKSPNKYHDEQLASRDQDLQSLSSTFSNVPISQQHFSLSGYEEQNLQNELKINTQSTQKECTSYTWKLHNFLQVLQDLKSHKMGEFSSAVFSTRDYSFKMRANLCFQSPYEYISIFMGFITDNTPVRPATPPIYYHRRTVILEDQSGEARKRDITRVYEPGFGRKDAEMWMKGFYGWWMFAPLKLLLSDGRYVKNGTVMVKILVEPLVAIYRNFSSNVGVLFWTIENYKDAKEDEMAEVVDCSRSEYFYSGRTGYRMQMRANLNGWKEGKGTYLALFLWFQKGQFDDTLSEKIHYRLTCTLLDQTISFMKNDLVKATVREDDRLDVGYGFPDFAPQATVEQALYLRNDSLSFKVFVEIL